MAFRAGFRVAIPTRAQRVWSLACRYDHSAVQGVGGRAEAVLLLTVTVEVMSLVAPGASVGLLPPTAS